MRPLYKSCARRETRLAFECLSFNQSYSCDLTRFLSLSFLLVLQSLSVADYLEMNEKKRVQKKIVFSLLSALEYTFLRNESISFTSPPSFALQIQIIGLVGKCEWSVCVCNSSTTIASTLALTRSHKTPIWAVQDKVAVLHSNRRVSVSPALVVQAVSPPANTTHTFWPTPVAALFFFFFFFSPS